MMIHAINADILWKSIDRIAEKVDRSLPRLALDAGLDQSTFSHSRRRRNWMSLQTLSKVLNTYDIPLTEWAEIVAQIQAEEIELEQANHIPPMPIITGGLPS